ncbi:hypothetical protein [Pseudomonas mandelii]|jgi:hypothetical protein|uniref:hypothetical protein n=1 Tax=Pseudomonas mandelii TaxID=75612 RepID=UPI003C781DCD
MGARSAAGVAEVRVRVGTEVKATVGNTVLHQTIRPAFRYTRTAHIAVGTVGKAVLLQMIGAIRCQLPFSQAISATFGKAVLLEVVGAVGCQLPFSQAISAAFGKAVLLEVVGTVGCQLPFFQAVSTALGKVLVSGFISGVLDQRGRCIPISACPAAAGTASVWFGGVGHRRYQAGGGKEGDAQYNVWRFHPVFLFDQGRFKRQEALHESGDPTSASN